MKSIFYFLIFLFACHPIKNITQIQLDFVNLEGRRVNVVGYIPKESNRKEQTWDGGRIILYQYNSAVFYLTEYGHKGTPNDSIIRIQKGIAIRDLLQDSISFWGIENGKYWKEEKRGIFFYGYKGVSISEKKKFDMAINSITIK